MAYSITEWKTEFLKSRGIEKVNGMPLYSYRMTLQEFDDLEFTLKTRLKAYLDYYSLAELSRHVPLFPSLFVLYASEWWQRRYDGTGWTWEPILDDIGLPSEEWNQNQRSECVEKGLSDWNLNLVNSRGLRFLGSIAFQGGLPMQLLASSRGNLSRVLSLVLKLASKGNFEAADIQEWISVQSKYLPNAYRQKEIYVLLAEVILTVLRLRTEANLKSSAGAISKLDSHNPNWRNAFPLPIEDAHAQGLIDKLIKDAASVTVTKSTRKFYVERWLQQNNGFWDFQSNIHIPEYMDETDLKSQFKAENSLSSKLTLHFARGGEIAEVGLRKVAGQDRYKLEQRPIAAYNESVVFEHTMTLNSAEGQVFFSGITKGDALSLELPWIFEVSDSREVYSFLRQGTGSFGSKVVIVCLPHDWKIIDELAIEAVNLGKLNSHQRTIWRVSGNIVISDPRYRNFRIRCNQATLNDELFELHGTRIWELFKQPSLAFSGIPKLYTMSESGLEHQVNNSLGWITPCGEVSATPAGIFGPIEACWPANGDAKWQSKFVLLPDGAKLNVEPGNSPTLGSLRFSNWGILSAYIENKDIKAEFRHIGNDLILELNYMGLANPPELCELRIVWPKNTNIALINVPFPAKGVRALSADGTQLENKFQISISNIMGIRLVGFLGGESRAELSISVSTNAHITSRKVIRSNENQSRIEIRLIDYLDEINRFLAGSDTLDAVVNFQLQVGRSLAHSLRIAKYACELERLPSLPGVGLMAKTMKHHKEEELQYISIYTLRLDAPGDEPIKLIPTYSEGVPNGNWSFPDRCLTPGPWIVYPDKDSILAFRPLIWSVPSTLIGNNVDTLFNELNLTDVLNIPSEQERNKFMDQVLINLSRDFLNPDWLKVEQLAINLGHLPLSTLDLWRSFTRSAKAMAALVMRVGSLPNGFAERFSIELPWMWEFVSLEEWTDAINLMLNQCNSSYGYSAGEVVFNSQIERRIQEISLQNPSLRLILEIAKTKTTGIISKEFKISQQSFMDNNRAEQLFVGEDSLVQKLLRNNADAEVWPSNLIEVVNKAKNGEFSNFFCPISYDFHDSVINVPILLAINAVMGLCTHKLNEADLLSIFKISQDFDPEWFSEAFDLTVARCLATGLIHVKRES